MKKLLTVGVICVLVGVALLPSITADSKRRSDEHQLANLGQISKYSRIHKEDNNELRELYGRFVTLKSHTNISDCGCSSSIDWEFPIICSILGAICLLGIFLFLTIGLGRIIFGTAFILGELFNCSWA